MAAIAGVRPLALVLAPALLAGCLTPAEAVVEADAAVYEIVRARRDELAAGGDFTIDTPQDTLRARLQARASVPPLTLADLLEVAAENSREYRDRREMLYLEALDLTLERWGFSLQETAGATASADGTGGESGSAGLLSTVGLSKLFVNGATLLADVSLDFARAIGTGDGWDAVGELTLGITQPLLRGFGRDVVREPLTQAERDVLYEARRYERFRSTFAFDVTSRFFDILRQLDTLENERENHRGLTRLRERNEAFAQAGQLNEIQVDQARQDELRARDRVIDAVQTLEARQDDFKLQLGLPVEAELPIDAGRTLDLASWPFLEVDPPEAVVIDVALAGRFDHQNALGQVEDAGRRLLIAADDLRAALDVTLDASAASEEGRPLDFEGEDAPWLVGLELDLPVDQLPERNAYRTRLIELEQVRRAAQESADLIVADLRDALRGLRSARQSYEIQERAVELALRRVESTELSLEAGRADTRDVLESQEDLLAARNALTAALTDYILSGLALYRDMELLRVGRDGVGVDTAPVFERMAAAGLPTDGRDADAAVPDVAPRPQEPQEDEGR